MKQPENLKLDAQQMPPLATAIDHWLAARHDYKKQASDKNQHAYNETYFVLGAAWAERFPDSANLPGMFESFRRGLISPEADE